MPVAAPTSRSSSSTTMPRRPTSSRSVPSRSSSTCAPREYVITPRPTSTAVLGISRTTGRPGYAASTSASERPPRIEMTALASSRSSSATASSCAGLWQSTTTSARCATSRLEARASPPSSSASAAARSATGSAHSTGSPQPRASARAMFPAPIRPTCMVGEGYPPTGLRLVEEALLDQTGALFRRDLDVVRGQEERLVGDPLHAAVERVGEPAGEVDQALGQVGVRPLEVEDHRHRVLELVRHLLGIVERLGDTQVDADVRARPAVAPALHRAQHAGAPLGGRVVGEDVIDLVAAAAR